MSDTLTRVRSLVDLNCYDAALDELDRLGVEQADAAEALCLRSRALLGMERFREAALVAGQACEAAPDWEWPHRLVALSEQARGRYVQALSAAGEAARLAPWMLESKHVLALAQVNAGEHAAAEQSAASCVSEHPQAPLAHETVARVAWSLGRLDLAEAAARRALELNPLDDQLQALLADVAEARGRGQEASALRVEAVRSNPQDPEHRRNLSRSMGAAAAVAAVGAAKAGVLVKALSVNAAVQIPRAFARSVHADPAAYLFGGCLALHLIVLLVWLMRLRRRRVGRATLPAGYWDGLRPERRFGDLGLLKLTGSLTAVLAVPAVLVEAWDVAATLALVGAVEIAVVILLRRRLTARYGITVDRWLLRFLQLSVSRVRHRLKAQPSLDGLERDGQPTMEQRGNAALGAVWAYLAGIVGALVAWWAAVAVTLVFAAVYAVLSDRWPRPISKGTGHRAVVALNSGQLIGARTAAVRGVLRAVLLPVLLIEYLMSKQTPRRCLHDRLCGTVVIRLASAFDTMAAGVR